MSVTSSVCKATDHFSDSLVFLNNCFAQKYLTLFSYFAFKTIFKAKKKRDYHDFLGELALSGLFESGRASIHPLGNLSLFLWAIAIDQAFIAGH